MWFLVFITYWAISAGEGPLIEQLPNDAFTASTTYPAPGCVAHNARRTSIYAWCAAPPVDANQYLQVDLGQEHTISAISTFPRADLDWSLQFVKTYTLSYSSDGSTFKNYGTTFTGNQNRGTGDDKVDEVVNKLDPTIDARYLRFEPKSWNSYISMRVEAYGSDVAPVQCESFEIDDFLSTCSVLFQSNVDEIRSVNDRLDIVITRNGKTWDDLSAANTIPINNYDMIHMTENKNWFNKYRDELIVLSLALHIIMGCALVALCVYINKKKYESYQRVKYVDSSDNENIAINK